MAQTPSGLDALYAVAKKRFPDTSLPHKELYLQADPKRLGPELQESIKSDKRARFQEITFKDNGATDDGLVIWTDTMLLDLRKNEALKMTPKTIDGMEYLFIEAGGFHTKHGPDWEAPLFVMKRNQ